MNPLLQPWSRTAFRGNPSSLDVVFRHSKELFWVGSCSSENENFSTLWTAFQNANIKELCSKQDMGGGSVYVIAGPSVKDHSKWVLLAIRSADGFTSRDEIIAIVETNPMEIELPLNQDENVNKMLSDVGINDGRFIWQNFFVGVRKIFSNPFK